MYRTIVTESGRLLCHVIVTTVRVMVVYINRQHKKGLSLSCQVKASWKPNMGNTEGKVDHIRDTRIQPSSNERFQNGTRGADALRIERQEAAMVQGVDIERTTMRGVAEQQPTCTYRSTKTQLTQRFYRCETCFKGKDDGCCAACAKVCHAGHNVTFAGESSTYCDCGLKVCSSQCKLGPKAQRWFGCNTCWGEGSSLGCCEFCASQCHHGHQLQEQKICVAMCACWLNGHKSDVMVCTYNTSKELSTMIKQPFYRCYECFTRPNEGCCYPCMKRCHNGHDVKYVGVQDCFCDCALPAVCAISCKIPVPN